MRRIANVRVVVIAALWSASCAAEVPSDAVDEPAAVRLELSPAGDGVIQYRLSNHTDRPVRVVPWRTPITSTPDRFLEVLRDGKPVRYLGLLVTRMNATEDYRTLAPGESVTAEYDLRPSFDIGDGGEFEVRSALPGRAVVDADDAQLDFSATTRVKASARAVATAPGDVAAVGAELVTSCNDAQQNALIWSALGAEQMLFNAIVNHAPGSFETMFYFGEGHDVEVPAEILYGMWAALQDQAAEWICMGTTGSCENPDFIAYVDRREIESGRNVIHFCDRFFAPGELPGDDNTHFSQPGAVIHELAHVAGAVHDWYYMANVEWLAANLPIFSVYNADTYRYYILEMHAQHGR